MKASCFEDRDYLPPTRPVGEGAVHQKNVLDGWWRGLRMAYPPEGAGYSDTSCKDCFSEFRHIIFLILGCLQNSTAMVLVK
jgi:hypothetical protein